MEHIIPHVLTKHGTWFGRILADRSYWGIKLSDDTFVQEIDGVEWDALVQNGDMDRAKELWLFCPPNDWSPRGNTARLPITIPGRAFQTKGASKSATLGGMSFRRPEYQIIGVVDDPDTLACTCFVWDYRVWMMSEPFKTNLVDFAKWRPDAPKIHGFSPRALGLKVG